MTASRLLLVISLFAVAGASARGEETQMRNLSLEEALRLALDRNPQVRLASAQVQEAVGRVLQASALRTPSVDLNVDYTRLERVPVIQTPIPPDYTRMETFQLSPKENVVGTISIAQALLTGGRAGGTFRQAQAGNEAASLQLDRTRQEIAFSVKQGYYAILLALESTKVAQAAEAAAAEHVRIASAHLAAGTAPRFDVLRAETELSHARQAVIQAQTQRDVAKVALAVVLGQEKPVEFLLTSAFQQPAAIPEPAELLQKAINQRPDLKKLQALEKASLASIQVAKSDKKPTVSAVWARQSVLNSSAFSTGGWTLMATARFNIFNSTLTRGKIEEANAAVEQTKARFEQLKQAVVLELAQAYLKLRDAREEITAAQKEIEQADEALRVATLRYREGMGTATEEIDAVAAQARARNSYNLALYNYNTALAELDLALGASVKTPQ
jgi:outer membrane protein TolC